MKSKLVIVNNILLCGGAKLLNHLLQLLSEIYIHLCLYTLFLVLPLCVKVSYHIVKAHSMKPIYCG